jgi:hypothetical protein
MGIALNTDRKTTADVCYQVSLLLRQKQKIVKYFTFTVEVNEEETFID